MSSFRPIFRLTILLALAVSANSQQLAAGNLLLATANSHDPDFAQSVILLIHADSESALGLILNKPTNLPVTDVLPEAKHGSVTVFAGGPITVGIRGLLPSQSPPLFSVITNKSQILSLISRSPSPISFRLYAGYTGWTASQLESEIARGLWKVLPANGKLAFDPHPDTLWRRLTPSRPIVNLN
jgi:putative transcriptional regulator